MPSLRELEVTPAAPLLERIFSRARVSDLPAAGYASTLFHLFGLPREPGPDLPTAPYCRLADGGPMDDGFWLQASPVHLRPDGDGLLLFDAGVLELTQEDASGLADSFRRHFDEMPWRLEVGSPERWYLRLEQQPDLATSPLDEVAGRNIDPFLPTGSESSAWHSILNEVQMLFHMDQVNMLREGRGKLAINGLWLHGGGNLQPIGQLPFDSVSADEALVRGMASCAGLEPLPLAQDSADLIPDRGRRLAVVDLLQRPVLDADPLGWVETLERFDTWLKPLLTGVRSRRLEYLNIHPCTGVSYRVDATALRRFWRPRRTMAHYLSL
jgi:hypothetical protein